MSTHHRITTFACFLTILLTGCDTATGANPAGPSNLASLLTGSLRSAASAGPPSANACGDFQWSVSEVSAGTYSGDFSATCPNDIQLDGTAVGTLVGDVLSITATGTATPQGLPPCPFTLNGTAQIVNGAIQIDYTGTTCLGPVSGTEILASS